MAENALQRQVLLLLLLPVRMRWGGWPEAVVAVQRPLQLSAARCAGVLALRWDQGRGGEGRGRGRSSVGQHAVVG